ncbi:MAG: choice-of-anchor Q domain-containing protein [Verrucomicrobiia bacterium]
MKTLPDETAGRARARGTEMRLSLLLLSAAVSASAATRYVWQDSPSPGPPYTNWTTAAWAIQEAVDAAAPDDEIAVTNGLYATGGRAVGTNLLVNRVAVDKPLTLRSVNGPDVTVIQGYQVPGTTNGDGAIRCVYLTNGAVLSGFTLTNGATLSQGGDSYEQYLERFGGGVWCPSSNALVSNCVLVRNSAEYGGGGAFRGTLNKCTLSSNSVTSSGVLGGGGGGASTSALNKCMLSGNFAYSGGGASECTLNDCVLSGNHADRGGGAAGSMLNNCTLTGNSADYGGGVCYAPLGPGCALNNCIVCFNTARVEPNYASSTLNYCCTTPMPSIGVGNITNAPQFVDLATGNLRLQSNSPCINTGNNAYVTTTTDLDGNPRIVGATVDIGVYEFQGAGSLISYAWLQEYGLPTDGSADAVDLDLDGHTTWQEWRCQTNPTNALSALRLLSASPAGPNVTVSWQSVAGVSYFVERATNLAASPPFTLVASNLLGEPGTTSYTETNVASLTPVFYRIGAMAP